MTRLAASMRATVAAVTLIASTLGSAPFAGALRAQTVVVSRDDALRLAREHSPRGALARADSAAAFSAASLARQYENPTLSASYSKSAPQAHFALDIPFDWPGARAPRIAAARSGIEAATLRSLYGRAALELDVDTAYTRAEAFAARAVLTARTARDADSLLVIARVRRDAGDASDLDVELARVFAGQSANAAINDSLAAIGARVTLQLLVGVPLDSATLVPSETMSVSDTGVVLPRANGSTTAAAAPPASSLLLVRVAEREADAARSRVLVEQKRRLAAPSLSLGFEAINPGGTGGLLPTVGFALPLPLFNRNNASIAAAEAELSRTRAALALARLEQASALASATREAAAVHARAARSQQLVGSANRIAALSLIAYREGAAPLASALDAQRSARETLAQFIDDSAAARIADSVLRFLSLSTVATPQ